MIPILGMTTNPENTAAMISEFQGNQASWYMRDFGLELGKYLTPMGTGKSGLPGAENMLFHYSWKGSLDILPAWMDLAYQPYLLTYHHEPMGNRLPAEYRKVCLEMVKIIQSHPLGYLCIGNGPVVTRFWLDEKKGNPDDWWYEGATFYGTDCYDPAKNAQHLSPDKMYGSAARIAKERGVYWLVPENGIVQILDSSGKPLPNAGAMRSLAMIDNHKFATEEGNCFAVGWWNRGGDSISDKEPERSTWMELMNGGGMYQTWMADVLRNAGLTVKEVSGWRTRSASEDSDASSYAPQGLIIHETRGGANSTDAGEIGVLINGREGLSGPIAQLYLGRDGVWHVVAAGLCHHVKTGWSGPFKGLGNTRLMGIEPAHSETEDWANKPIQYQSYVHGTAALIKHKNWPPPVGHKEHQSGDKPDPEFSMTKFRADVLSVMNGEVTAVDINLLQELTNGSSINNALVTTMNRLDLLANQLKLGDRLNAILAEVDNTEELLQQLISHPDVDATQLAALLGSNEVFVNSLAAQVAENLPNTPLTMAEVTQAVQNAFVAGTNEPATGG